MNWKNKEIDMLHGAILPKLLRFAVPLTLSTMLQLLFNASDLAVIVQQASRHSGEVRLHVRNGAWQDFLSCTHQPWQKSRSI